MLSRTQLRNNMFLGLAIQTVGLSADQPPRPDTTTASPRSLLDVQSQKPPQTYWPRICILMRSPGDPCIHQSMSSTRSGHRERWGPQTVTQTCHRNQDQPWANTAPRYFKTPLPRIFLYCPRILKEGKERVLMHKGRGAPKTGQFE